MDCMLKTETTKLTGKESVKTSVRMRMFWSWLTVVRASRTNRTRVRVATERQNPMIKRRC